MSLQKAIAVIPARGGSKGIPKKNLTPFCGKPLLQWTLEQAHSSSLVKSVWVTSDDPEILSFAKKQGAFAIERPSSLSGDTATSESAWLHALDHIEKATQSEVPFLVGLQATSPTRESSDIDRAIQQFIDKKHDSLFSACSLGDLFVWSRSQSGQVESVTYDYSERKRRQDLSSHFGENGSIYVFNSQLLRETGNRLGGSIGIYEMPFWKSFEINVPEDLELCEVLMRHYLL